MTTEQWLLLFSEWLDNTGLTKVPEPYDDRSHADLVKEFLAQDATHPVRPKGEL